MGSLTSVVPTEHNLLGSLHEDTTANTPNAGDLIRGSAVPASWERFTVGSAGAFVRSTGTLPGWSTLILPNAATAFRLLAATSTDNVGELAAVGATGEYLAGATGAIPAWATLNQAAVAGLTTASSPTFAGLTLSSPLTVPNGGLGVATLATGGALYGNGAGVVQVTAIGAANSVLTHNGTVPSFSATPTVTTLTTTGLLTAGSSLTVSAGTVTLPANSLVVGTNQLVRTATGVGIGTAEPGVPLDVIGQIRNTGMIQSTLGDFMSGADTDLDFVAHNGGSAAITMQGGSRGAVQMYLKNDGTVGIGTASPVISGTGKLHMAADTFRLDTARTPASAGAAGNAGEWCWDASFIYVCTATNAWERVAIASW